ncbi:peptidylprolyl isomerase [Clostridium sp. AF18-27]|uniref:peptidylprolyl isomerase n=1 Tax=Enterocloster lavalensis TaxID=460384 RepID=UPI000E4C490C|nr:peptidylprolyl isomerase [Enterocloster lavalensis]RHR51963.1 peptidylprolyl isomerase [Clostridium sp. AF18-27]
MDNTPVFSDPQQQLKTVNDAIYNILIGGQSYQLGTKRLTRADLGLLYDMQAKLQAQIANSEPSTLFQDTVVAVFDGR